MKNTLGLIDSLLEKHKHIEQTTALIQQTLNDMVGEETIEKKEQFVPRHYLKQLKMLNTAEQTVTELDNVLTKHFKREEKALVQIFSQFDSEVAGGIKHIFQGHRIIKARLIDMQKMLGELIIGKLSQAKWRSQAWDLKACTAKTVQFLKDHIDKENSLYQRARQDLVKSMEAASNPEAPR
jgi:hypothetical protein